MHICRTPAEVESALLAASSRVVAIDGFHLSGKTTLAEALSGALHLPLIRADDYLKKNNGTFFSNLRMEELRAALTAHERVIYEGICCLQVMRAAQVQADVLVYVKRVGINGWVEKRLLDAYLRDSHSPSAGAEAIEDPLQVHLRNIWREVAAYHKEYRPHEVASLTYERSAASQETPPK